MALSQIQQDQNSIHESQARIYAAAARIGEVFPYLSIAIVAEVENGRKSLKKNEEVRANRDWLYAFAREIEAAQAALVLGLAATNKGNSIDHSNLDSLSMGAALADRTGAIKTLYPR